MNFRRLIAPRNVITVSLAVAVLGFLSLHRYEHAGSFVWNVMNGVVRLNDECPHRDFIYDGAGNVSIDLSPDPGLLECGISIPYRLIFAISVLAIAASFVMKGKAQS